MGQIDNCELCRLVAEIRTNPRLPTVFALSGWDDVLQYGLSRIRLIIYVALSYLGGGICVGNLAFTKH